MVQGRQNLMFYTTIAHKTNKQTDKTNCFTPYACVQDKNIALGNFKIGDWMRNVEMQKPKFG